MAKSENNEVMFGARGKVGSLLVFKNFGTNQTVISKRRKKADNPVYSQKQETTKEKFREAVIYAQGIKDNPQLLEIYQAHARPGLSAYNLALADFCKPSQIKEIDCTNYHGNLGDQIRIRAVDNFLVVSVTVHVFSATNELIETGLATVHRNKVDWYYAATVPNATLQGTTIKVQTSNLPGNVTTQEITIS